MEGEQWSRTTRDRERGREGERERGREGERKEGEKREGGEKEKKKAMLEGTEAWLTWIGA